MISQNTLRAQTYLEPRCYHSVVNVENFTHLKLFEDVHAHIIEGSGGGEGGGEGGGGEGGD